jgi:hypothetical protein
LSQGSLQVPLAIRIKYQATPKPLGSLQVPLAIRIKYQATPNPLGPLQVPEYFTFVVQSCVDAHLFVGIAAEDADMSDTLESPDMVTYRSNGLFRVFDEK